MPERFKHLGHNVLTEVFTAAPFAILLVILLLLGNKIKFKLYEIALYFCGAIVTGTYFSRWTIQLLKSKWDISPEGETVITAGVTIFGFLALVYIVKNDLVNSLINSYFKKYSKKINTDETENGSRDGDPK
jgi:hypothetical protein